MGWFIIKIDWLVAKEKPAKLAGVLPLNKGFFVAPAGLEPPTTGLEVRQEHHPPRYIASIESMMSNM